MKTTTKKVVRRSKKEAVEVCTDCKGTGRGTPLGVNVTTCGKCEGTGK